ncbi:MAG: DUF2339 domain-containing protein [Mycobacteriaceae bacterium]
MNSPSGAGEVLDRLSGECAAISGQLQRVGYELQQLKATFPGIHPTQTQNWQPDTPIGVVPVTPIAPTAPGQLTHAIPVTPFPQYPQKKVVASGYKKTEPWWQRDGMASRVLAVAGAAVTLAGVVMLLVLAAQAGLLAPQLRVAAGALLSVGLLAIGMRVVKRPGGKTGAVALVATGIAGLYLDIVAMTVTYQWIPEQLGVILALAAAGYGLAIAQRWSDQTLSVIVVLGISFLAPVLTSGISIMLIGTLLVVHIAGLPVQWRNAWPTLHMARTVPLVIVLLLAQSQISWLHSTKKDVYILFALCSITAILGVVSALALTARQPQGVRDITPTISMVFTVLPIMLSGNMFHDKSFAIINLILAAILALVVVFSPQSPGHLRIALVIIASLALLESCVVAATQDFLPIVLFTVSIALIALGFQVKSKLSYLPGLGFFLIGAVAYLFTAPPRSFANSDSALENQGLTTIIASLMAFIAVGLLVAGFYRIYVPVKDLVGPLWIAAVIVLLYSGSAAIITTGVLIGGTQAGFVAGHSAATISAMLVATVVLFAGLKYQQYTKLALGVGLILSGVAVAKLCLFDLATLNGIYRVAAFLVTGLLLLYTGTRYARVFAEQNKKTLLEQAL